MGAACEGEAPRFCNGCFESIANIRPNVRFWWKADSRQTALPLWTNVVGWRRDARISASLPNQPPPELACRVENSRNPVRLPIGPNDQLLAEVQRLCLDRSPLLPSSKANLEDGE
jgi:hypothetical protein